MREGMRRILERQGHSVVAAADGGEALVRLAGRDLRRRPRRPQDARDRRLRGDRGASTRAAATVVVIVSALATVEAAVEVTRHGAFDFLVKPFGARRAAAGRRAGGRGSAGSSGERETYLSALNSERNLSRQLINSMREGVIVLNINRKPVLMNPRAEFAARRPLPRGPGPRGARPRRRGHRPSSRTLLAARAGGRPLPAAAARAPGPQARAERGAVHPRRGRPRG